MKKLLIEIPLEGNDLEENDFDVFVKEATDYSEGFSPVISIEVGRPLSEEESHIARVFSIGGEYFKVTLTDEPDEPEVKEADAAV